jgi:recombination protein RecA
VVETSSKVPAYNGELRPARGRAEDNTVGSLTETQRSVIVGSLLGDGAMRCKANALLEINHSYAQREYVDWKFEVLANLVASPPKARNGNAGRVAYRFTTRSLPELTPYFEAFYLGKRKIVPRLQLTPLALATWFMDDGCKSHRSIYLNTQQFDLGSQMRMLDMLLEQWQLDATLNRDKAYHRIRIAVSSVPRFTEIVERHVRPEFRYKFPS